MPLSINRILPLLLTLALLMPEARAGEIDAPRFADHPLVGQLWWAGATQPGDRQAALAKLARADVLILGEIHGNPDHHSLQLEVLRSLVAVGRRPAVAFEIFDLGDQPVIDTLSRQSSAGADALAEAVGMPSRAWIWRGYRPLVQFALDEGLPIVAANLSRADALGVAREGLAALPAEERDRLGLDRPLPVVARARLEQRIVDAHCGHLPRERAHGMIDAQRARDAYMADRLAAVDGPVVLITGAAHARSDYGVPRYLSARAPQRRVLSVAFMEVDTAREQRAEYLHDGESFFDLLWFTRRSSPDDPCEAFRKQLEGMGKR
jgi:uncharacterized iron-regulated protein